TPRLDPVIYKAGNYSEPVTVGLGVDKPTAWLQNCGIDYVNASSEDEYFIFSEYTRPQHEVGRVWKVSYPFDNPSNWRIVKEVSGGQESVTEIEHFHTANYDPYSGVWFVTSGDANSQIKVWISSD